MTTLTREQYMQMTRVGRGELLSRGTANLAGASVNQRIQPAAAQSLAATPVVLKEPDPEVAGIAKMLGIDDDGDWQRIAAMQRMLEGHGITNPRALAQVLSGATAVHGTAHGYQPPPPPIRSLSELYSDVEVIDTVSIDTKIVDLPQVPELSTVSVTLDQMPMKWAFGDLTVDGDMESGSLKLIEVRILLGSRPITMFRLSQLSRASEHGLVIDALQKIYSYEIGPNSTVKVEIENKNAGEGQRLRNAFFQYVYHPVINGETARIIRGG